ncbi:tRNA pseudouridine(38-40) synthase TruA [Sulfitobacter sp. HNIBRBA2951]|uniref:tRNA pseudouridine(38-40) synthase TruA n=1 Tax=Sulfitobacter aquimarinus TaxID=3158557 RepID=UPI0032DF3D05
MPRFALQVEYDGAPFHGWQRQNDLPSVQGAIEHALGKVEKGVHKIAAAGRTDKGVHGIAQVAHCDMVRDWTPFRLSEAINYHLKPNPVSITACAQVPDTFHARFSAQERRYLFRILPRRAPVTHSRGFVWQVKQQLDLDAMREGASHLLGKHDFTTFRSTICQSLSPVKALDVLDIFEVETMHGTEVHFDVRARSFLHNQVRSFIGTLERVGSGSLQPIDVKTALEARDRQACGPVSPPHGLYLAGVTYETSPFDGSVVVG